MDYRKRKSKGMGDNLSTLINYFIFKIKDLDETLTHVDVDQERAVG